MGKFEKHLNVGEPVEIGEDKYVLKPLTVEYLPKFLKLMKVFSKMEKDQSMQGFFDSLDDESMQVMTDLLIETLKKSFPEEWKDNEEETSAFGLKYMFILMPKILEINSADAKDMGSKGSEIEKRLKTLQKPNVKPDS